MGAFKGGVTVKRFRADGEPPSDFRERYVKALKAHAFRPLAPEEDADRTAGWTVAGRLLDTEFEVSNLVWNDYLIVTYRVDTLRLPPALLEAYVMQREERVMAERGTENLSRQERADVKEVVRRELRRQTLAGMAGTDVAWNLGTGRIYVWTHNGTLLEEIEDLFQRTFSVVLLQEDPFSTADYAGFGEAEGSPLQFVEPADLAGSEG